MNPNREKSLINLVQNCTSYPTFVSQLEGIFDIRFNNVEGKKNYCGKRITYKEIGFECFTCSNKKEHVLCKSCFLSGNHSGHLIAYSNKNIGFCDCGDSEYNLHCSDHSKMENCQPDPTILKHQETFIQGFISLFFGVFQLCEILDTTNDSSTLKEIRQKVQYSCEFVFDFLVNLATGSFTYSKIIEEMLKRMMNRELLHKCSSAEHAYGEGKTLCRCNILENIVRYGFIYSYYTFNAIEKLIFSLYGEESFQKFWACTYTKAFQLMFEKEESNGVCSLIKISRFHTFYLSFNNNIIHKSWLESNNFLEKLNLVTKGILKLYFLGINNHSYDVFVKLKEIYLFIFNGNSLEELMFQTKFLDGIVKILYILQKRSSKFEEDNEKARLHIECTFTFLFKEILKLINKLALPKKTEIVENLSRDLISRVLKLETKIGNRSESWPLHIPLQRCLILCLCFLIDIHSLPSIKEKLESLTSNINSLIKIISTNAVKAMKFGKISSNKTDMMDLYQNTEDTIKREIINAFYKKSFYLQFDCDLVALQITIYISGKDSLLKNLVTPYEIYLSDIKLCSNEPDFVKKLEYFLHNIIVMMVDEVSFINCTAFLHSESLWENQSEYVNFFLINVLKMPKASNLVSIRSLVFNKLLNNELEKGKYFNLEKILEVIANKTQNGSYRLKPEFDEYYEPYSFHKFSKMKSVFYEANKGKECVIGRIKNPQMQTMTFSIRKILIKSDLPLILVDILENEGYTSSYNDTLRYCLKILYLGIHMHKSVPKICKPLLSSRFVVILENLSSNPALSEIKSPLIKCLELSVLLTSSQRKDSAIDLLAKKSEGNENKNLASKKQQDLIRSKLLAQQANFLNNNRVLIERSNTEESDIICYICHSGILETGPIAFGVICYVSADNFIDFLQVKIGPFNSKFRLCITSCQHYVHKACHEATHANNYRAYFGEKRELLFNNILECLCGQCKSLSNIFLNIVDKKYEPNNFQDFSEIISFKAPQELLCRFQKFHISKSNKAIAKEASDFFDCLMRYLITNQDDKLDECIVLNVGFNTLFEFCDNILLTGVSQFLKKKLMITKNFFLMFREYFWFFEAKNKMSFIERMKKEMGRDFSIIYNQNRLNQDFSLREFESCSLRLAWQAGIIFKDYEPIIYSSFIYISRHTFSVYILYLCFGSCSKPTNDISVFKEQLKNYDFQRIIAAGIIEYARKLVVVILSIFSVSEDALRALDEADMLDELEELKLYDTIFGCEIFKISLDNTPYIDALIPALHAIVANKGGSPDFLLTLISTVKLPSLPSVFSEFYLKYIHQKCGVCEDFPKAGSPYLCLLCAKVLCSVSCPNTKNNRIGSLNHHAKKTHLGKCVLVNIVSSMVIAISWPRMVVLGFLYKNCLNKRPYELLDLSFYEKDLKLNRKMEDIILERKIPQEIVYRILDKESSLISYGYL